MVKYVCTIKLDAEELNAPDFQVLKKVLRETIESEDLPFHWPCELLSLRLEEQPPINPNHNRHSKLSFIPSCGDCTKRTANNHIYYPMQFSLSAFTPVIAELWQCPNCKAEVWIPLSKGSSEISSMSNLAFYSE